VYLNGESDATPVDVSGVGSLDDVSGLAAIGIANGDDDVLDEVPFDGEIDEVRIYNRALSTDEIKQLYRMGALPRGLK
jgi:hypothetical protein